MKAKIRQKSNQKTQKTQKTKETPSQKTTEIPSQKTTEKTKEIPSQKIIKVGIGKQEVEKIAPETTVVEKEFDKVIDKTGEQKVEEGTGKELKVRKERADKGKTRSKGRGKGRDKERFDIPFGIAILGLSKIGSLLTKDKKWLTTDEEANDFEKAINETLGDVLPENIKLSRGVSHLIILTGTYFIDRF